MRLVMLAAFIAVPFGGVWSQTALVGLAALLVWLEMREKERAEARERVALARAREAEQLLGNMVEALGCARQVSQVRPMLPSDHERPFGDKWH